jgi:hypothetical protein
MRTEQIVVQILINSKKAKDEESAVQLIKAAFNESLPMADYELWNREIEDSTARALIDNARHRDKIILSILIQDLNTIAQGLLALSVICFIS